MCGYVCMCSECIFRCHLNPLYYFHGRPTVMVLWTLLFSSFFSLYPVYILYRENKWMSYKRNTTTLHYDFNKRVCTSTVHGIKILPARNIHFNQKTFTAVTSSFLPVCMPSLVLSRIKDTLCRSSMPIFYVDRKLFSLFPGQPFQG